MSCNEVKIVSEGLTEATEPKRDVKHEQPNRMDTFPWMTEFRAMSRLSTRPGSLIKLIRFFNKNVSSSVGDCYKKSSRAAKLKEHIKEALLLFMYYHRFEQPQDQNRAVYLEQMSDLLAVYVDLELIASKREAEPQPSRISARLVLSLCLCLENSSEHLLDTLIKVQLVNETYADILDPVISKVLKLAPAPPRSKLDGVAYVRYLLVYRLWKRMHINLAARKNIVSSAMEALRSEPPKDIPEVLIERGVLPSSQNNQSDRPSTKHYLCQSYDLRNACAEFVKYSRSRGSDEATTSNECSERDPRLKQSTLTSESSEARSSVNTALTQPSESAVNIPLEKLKLSCDKPRVACPKTKKKQLKDIVLIDLTDDEVTKIIKRKKRSKIAWLSDAKRHFHTKIASMKITEESSERSSVSSPSAIAEDQNHQPESVKEEEVERASPAKSDASALSNGCSVIRETGRPAAVVTPKTDSEPKVQEEHVDVARSEQQSPTEPSPAATVVATPTTPTPTTTPIPIPTAAAIPPPPPPTPEVSPNFYDGIDGLALLASVSAQQQVSTKKPELKVKPYTALQQQPESIVEETMDKVALQVEVCSSESVAKPEVYSYILEEQANLEANDNANVILNGETVMLLQKSPNSNLYIINKAAVDSSKLNYNSDDEMMLPEMVEDVKPALKMEPNIEYPTYPPHCMHQLSVDCACVSCAYCRPYFLPPPPPQPLPPASSQVAAPTSPDKEKAFARFRDMDSKLPLKKRLKAQRMMDFAQSGNHTPTLELGAVVEVTTASKPRGRTKKDKVVNQNIPNCFPRKSGPKKKRLVELADDEIENNLLAAAPPSKKARRSSRRGLAAVSYADHEFDADSNPSGRRKKKRSAR